MLNSVIVDKLVILLWWLSVGIIVVAELTGEVHSHHKCMHAAGLRQC
jgi:hypothetical protein